MSTAAISRVLTSAVDEDDVLKAAALAPNTALAGWIVFAALFLITTLYLGWVGNTTRGYRPRAFRSIWLLFLGILTTFIYFTVAWCGGFVYEAASYDYSTTPATPRTIETEFYFLIPGGIVWWVSFSLALVSSLGHHDLTWLVRIRPRENDAPPNETTISDFDPLNDAKDRGITTTAWLVGVFEFGFYLCATFVTYFPVAIYPLIGVGIACLIILLCIYAMLYYSASRTKEILKNPNNTLAPSTPELRRKHASTYTWWQGIMVVYLILSKVGFCLAWGFGPSVATAYNYSFSTTMAAYLAIGGASWLLWIVMSQKIDVNMPKEYRTRRPNPE